MNFEILAWSPKDNQVRTFHYDNEANVLKDDTGHVFEYSTIQKPELLETFAYSKDAPLKKSKNIDTLKIQLGLSCNYTCDYCSQRFVERPAETSKKDIDDFMKKLEVLNFEEERGLKIEFWGGEPFVYWKTMKPLAEALVEKFSHWKKKPQLSVVTNGSLLTREICAWLYYMGFNVGISHDGPAQAVRGPDPFEDPETKQIVLEFYKIMHEQKRISFNTMMNKRNTSRRAVYEYFKEFTGDPTVAVGEGSFIDAYDDAAMENCLYTKAEHFAYRKETFNDIHESGNTMNFGVLYNKMDNFIRSLLLHSEMKYVGQKCGMDNPNTVAVDLKGNVITCQNVSVVETSKNGEPHLAGNLADYDNVELRSVTHWKNRKDCASCPVIHLCKGSCMYLDGKHWDITCDNAYSDNIVMFSLVFEKVTNGYIPMEIRSENLPLDRVDIWGTRYQHEERKVKKVIPLKVVTEKTVVNDVEVYAKPKIEE